MNPTSQPSLTSLPIHQSLLCFCYTYNNKIITIFTVIHNLTSFICRKSLIPNEIAHPCTGESSSMLPSYATFVLTAKATGFDWNQIFNNESNLNYKHNFK